MSHRIIIVGGGFGGVAAALSLAKKQLSDAHITLINNKPWLEYYGVLYRLIGGRPASEACLPLQMIFGKKPVKMVIDTVSSIDTSKKTVTGTNNSYSYDTLILAPGSVPNFFGIPGMEKHSYTLRNAAQAAGLRERVTECIENMKYAKDERMRRLYGRFAIVGAGPTGIEIAGEILPLARALCKKNNLPPSLITVHLIEAMDRVLPMIEPSASKRVRTHLEALGIALHLNRSVSSTTDTTITYKDGEMLEAGTIIWTVGVKASPLLSTIQGIELDKRGRAIVDDQLRAKSQPNIFVLGDSASTKFSGMAQTAVEDGHFVAKVITALHNHKTPPLYQPIPPAYAIPAGHDWAAVKYGNLRAYGLLGHILRRAADIHVYMLILPWHLIPMVFLGKMKMEKYGVKTEETIKNV